MAIIGLASSITHHRGFTRLITDHGEFTRLITDCTEFRKPYYETLRIKQPNQVSPYNIKLCYIGLKQCCLAVYKVTGICLGF